jgi:hypothetical protein
MSRREQTSRREVVRAEPAHLPHGDQVVAGVGVLERNPVGAALLQIVADQLLDSRLGAGRVARGDGIADTGLLLASNGDAACG